jgi:hypothetical protein
VRAARVNADLEWEMATRDGSFIDHLDASAIAELMGALPMVLMDGHVFRTRYSTWTAAENRDRVVERTARLLETVSEYLADPRARPVGELRLIQVTLDNLVADLASKE